jgi:hypothetical protein
MHEDVYRCLAHAYQRARVRGADGTALPSLCASAVPCPHSHGPTRMMDRYSYTVHAHTLPCTPIVVRAYRRGGHAPRTRPGARACARSCVCAGAPASAPTRASTFRPPLSVAFSARRRSTRRRPSTRTSARGTPRESRPCSRYAPLPARRAHRGGLRSVGHRRMRGRCTRRRRRCVCAHACACACSYAYKDVCGWIAVGYTHALECHRAPSTSRLLDFQHTHA